MTPRFLLSTLLLLTLAAPASLIADEIYAAGPGELWRLDSRLENIAVVGPLDIYLTC